MKMPDIKEKTTIKMINLLADYCSRHNLEYNIERYKITLNEDHEYSSAEHMIVHDLLKIISTFQNDKPITNLDLDFFNEIDAELNGN